MPYGELPPPPPPFARTWRVRRSGVGELTFTGWFHVDQAGALWCESLEGGRTVFGPGMWITIASIEEED